MDILDHFYIDDNNRIQLNTHMIVVRNYDTIEKSSHTDTTYYVNDAGYKEWTEQLIPQHQLNELIDDELIENADYQWMVDIKLRTTEPWREIQEIVGYGSYEAYEASLSESRDEYLLDLDSRLAALELEI